MDIPKLKLEPNLVGKPRLEKPPRRFHLGKNILFQKTSPDPLTPPFQCQRRRSLDHCLKNKPSICQDTDLLSSRSKNKDITFLLK